MTNQFLLLLHVLLGLPPPSIRLNLLIRRKLSLETAFVVFLNPVEEVRRNILSFAQDEPRFIHLTLLDAPLSPIAVQLSSRVETTISFSCSLNVSCERWLVAHARRLKTNTRLLVFSIRIDILVTLIAVHLAVQELCFLGIDSYGFLLYIVVGHVESLDLV